MATPPDVTAVILAGGSSRRMGRDKARLSLEGRTLLEHVVHAAQTVAARVLVVGGDAQGLGACEHVPDRFPGEGPLGALISALPHVTTPWCLLLACDTPLLSPVVLSGLVEIARARPRSEAVVPRPRGSLEPLVALYRSDLRERLESTFQAGERALHRVCAQLDVVFVEEGTLRAWDTDLASFSNLNTPADLATLRQQHGRRCDSG